MPQNLISFFSPRSTSFFSFLLCAILLCVAYSLEYFLGLEPCPLCILQRIVFMILGVLFLSASLHNPNATGVMVYNIIIICITLLGVSLAGRQLWIQHLPLDTMPACAADFNTLMERLPFLEALNIILKGTGECTKPDIIMGLSIALWSLLQYLSLMSVAVYNIAWIRKYRFL